MAEVINSNIMSLDAQNNLAQSSMELATSVQRLSSGLKITIGFFALLDNGSHCIKQRVRRHRVFSLR